MERIDNSADSQYKIQPGTTFVSKRTNNMRSIDPDGSNLFFVPMSRYYASCTIKRGTPVSICQPSDLSKEQLKTDFPYVKPTDPDVDTNCIGVATNYVQENQIVQIQSVGKFEYLTTKDPFYKKNKDKEVFIDVEKDIWNYENMRGQTLYVKKNNSVVNADHNPKEEVMASECPITFDFVDSVYAAKNTLQIGHLTDVPLENDKRTHQTVVVELNVTGDTRGPIQHTQQILKLGESIEFKSVTEDQTLTEPYNNEGILDEVKAVALATTGPTKASFGIVSKTVQGTFATPDSFIGVRKLDGKAVIVTNKWTSETPMKALQSKVIDENDVGYVRLVNSFEDPIFIEGDFSSFEKIVDSITNALKQLDSVVFENVTVDITAKERNEAFLTATIPAGYFDIYASSDMLKYVSIKTYNHGSSAEAGTAVLADIRDANRCNVIGVVLSNQDGVHEKGTDVTVMKMGAFATKGNLKVGAEYFLGLEGQISTRKEYWYDRNVSIGIAETAHNLLVDVQQVNKEFDGNMAIGAMKPCRGGVAEKGFLLTGATYDVETYPDLYNALLNVYSSTEMNYQEVVAADGSTKHTFDIPLATVDGETAQIKYTTGGIYNKLPRAPFLRRSGRILNGTVGDIDVTPLVIYGTLEQSRVAPTLENIDIRLFYREATKQVTDDDSLLWRELQPGFKLYNNEQLYGFEWVVKTNDKVGKDGVYTLHCNIGDGLGICKLTGSTGPIQLNNVEFKVSIAGKNLWEREFSLLEQAEVAHSMELDSDDLAPSVNTIRDYYAAEVKTEHVETPEADIGNAVVGNIKIKHGDVEVDVEEALSKKEESFKAHTELDCNEPTKDENGAVVKDTTGKVIPSAHGLYNAGEAGNIDARSVDGLLVRDGAGTKTANTRIETNKPNADGISGYLPYVKVTNAGHGESTIFDIAEQINRYDSGNVKVYGDYPIVSATEGYKFIRKYEKNSGTPNIFTEELNISQKISKIYDLTNPAEMKVSFGLEDTGRSIVLAADVGRFNLLSLYNGSSYENYTLADLKNISSIAYKKDFVEYFNSDVNTALGNILTPNASKDLQGNPVGAIEMSNAIILNADDVKAIDKFGSALQALYELPLSEFDYKEGDYKRQFGVLVERVNQVRDAFDEGNYKPHHKINSLLKSADAEVFNKDDGNSTFYANNKTGTNLIAQNSYSYTEAEAKSIAKYLNLVTGKKELNMEVRTVVAMLLKAAQETQERLLDVESSVFGFDAKSIPGSPKDVLANVDEKLKAALNNSPLYLGLNRVLRAICLELYDTTDIETIDAETKSVLADSDTLKDKVTVKSRIDEVDNIVSELMKDINSVSDYIANLVAQNEYNFDEIKNATKSTDVSNSCEENRAATNAKVEASGTWGSLPSESDYESSGDIETVFGQKHPKSGKHVPVGSEVIELNIPDTEDNGKGAKRLKRDKDGNIAYTHKVVAPLAAKVERINKKLSHLTKEIYNDDEVLYSGANRIVAIEKNIENLVNALYPNKTFNAFNVVDEFKLPYMRNATSHKVGAYKSDSAVTSGVAAYNQLGYQRSAIDDLLASTYNYSIDLPFKATNQDWFNQSKKPAGATAVNNKLTFNVDDFNVANNELLSTKTAIDYVRDVIGIQSVINNNLLTDTTVWLRDAIGLNVGNFKQLSLSESDYKSVAENELTTTILQKSGKVDSQNLVAKALKLPEKLTSVNAYTWMARKAKTFADRITATEMELDVLTKVIVNEGEGFEARDVREVLDTIIQKANNADHSALNLWLEDLHKYPQYNPAQTQKLLNYLERYCEYVSEGKVEEDKKVIRFKQVKDIPAYDADYKGYNHTTEFDVTLVYSEAESVDQGEYEISLRVPTTTAISKDLVKLATINDDIGAGIDYNYSYYANKELALMKEMMKQNLQATYDIKYPVGGYVYFDGKSYVDVNKSDNNTFPYTKDDHDNYVAMGIKEREFKLVDDGVAQSTGKIPSLNTSGTVDLSDLAKQTSTQEKILAARDDAIKSTIQALLDNRLIDIGNATGIQKTDKAGTLSAGMYILNNVNGSGTYTSYEAAEPSDVTIDGKIGNYESVKAVVAEVKVSEGLFGSRTIDVTYEENPTPYTKTDTTYKSGNDKGRISSLSTSGNLITANFIGSAKYKQTSNQTSYGFHITGTYVNLINASELNSKLRDLLNNKLPGIYNLNVVGSTNHRKYEVEDASLTAGTYNVLFIIGLTPKGQVYEYTELSENDYLFGDVDEQDNPYLGDWSEGELTPEEKEAIWSFEPTKEIVQVTYAGLSAQVILNNKSSEYEGLDINVSDSGLEATISAKYSSYGYTANIIKNITSKAESFPIAKGNAEATISASASNVDVTVGNDNVKCFKVL